MQSRSSCWSCWGNCGRWTNCDGCVLFNVSFQILFIDKCSKTKTSQIPAASRVCGQSSVLLCTALSCGLVITSLMCLKVCGTASKGLFHFPGTSTLTTLVPTAAFHFLVSSALEQWQRKVNLKCYISSSAWVYMCLVCGAEFTSQQQNNPQCSGLKRSDQTAVVTFIHQLLLFQYI